MTSSEIAKIAGVSRSTVSRVVNNYGNVPKETRDKVLEVIRAYNYVPHASARMLAGKKSRILGLFIIDTKNQNNYNKMTTSSYFSPFTSAAIDTANRQQYNVLVSVINSPWDFKNVKEIFYSKTISAGIFIGGSNNQPDVSEIIDEGYKTAVIEQEVDGTHNSFGKCIVVNSDSFRGAYQATNYLIELGHRDIAHICGDTAQYTAILRFEGYKKALTDKHLPVKKSLIAAGDYTEESGYNAAKKLLSAEKPTALFVANDSMALGAMKAVYEANMKIPGDISIIGFDDIEVAGYIHPPLTTVKISLFQMASIAVNNLIRAIENEESCCGNYTVPVELVVRNSCREVNS